MNRFGSVPWSGVKSLGLKLLRAYDPNEDQLSTGRKGCQWPLWELQDFPRCLLELEK